MAFGLFGGGSKDSPAASSTAKTESCPVDASGAPIGPDGKPKRICCTCPDTKKLRDACIAERGEEHPYCQALIEAHKACLRTEGFKVCTDPLSMRFEGNYRLDLVPSRVSGTFPSVGRHRDK